MNLGLVFESGDYVLMGVFLVLVLNHHHHYYKKLLQKKQKLALLINRV